MSINKEKVTIKHCTLIEWLNSLTFPSGVAICRNLPFDGRARRKSQMSVFQKGKRVGVATNVYSRKTLEKPKRGLQILKIRVRELFTHREGISTLHARHKRRQPLIEYAQRDFKIIYFSHFIFFYFFGVDKGAVLAPIYPQVRWEIQTYVVL